MNKIVFELQPDIIVNNRNHQPGDFSTPEQRIVAETNGRAWESGMTLNDSWGYQLIEFRCGPKQGVIFVPPRQDGGIYISLTSQACCAVLLLERKAALPSLQRSAD